MSINSLHFLATFQQVIKIIDAWLFYLASHFHFPRSERQFMGVLSGIPLISTELIEVVVTRRIGNRSDRLTEFGLQRFIVFGVCRPACTHRSSGSDDAPCRFT